ncbi:Glycosylphosphatidylinositol:protein transamidase, GAA1 component [Ophiobolus disseminans]|uniref:Glycosylphosphatidylinositol:protein transamidase, GAA1 component n=1 Tax=Ophiobolus disseminans TaxID=1469910 RepID=A0A6A7A3B8_9PLEO|nr:Glycosylphosphatidylinositol:protein transamidase, GAA1 component [Ophiobolus disseminans]
MALLSSILALRRHPALIKLPPYLSAFCIVVGIAWLLILPLNEYSRRTYVSENALLPGQVHTYFTGSEHDVFRAYRHEVHALIDRPVEERSKALESIFLEQNLKVSTQKYNYTVSNTTIASENVYAILQGPRADATEALVLIGAWKNMDDEVNNSGVALVLTLARYFKRWSLWSKDIIFLISADSTIGPQAWVDAYHNEHNEEEVESLKIKSGALQGAVAIDYPAGPWGHRYDKLHIVYDGVNGQLPNLDLFNTAVAIADGQMGIQCVIQRMFNHDDTYKERLMTMLRGMISQGLGHATGPHSSFIPYHVDAITLSTVGDGWHDEMTLGRTVESLFRSLNNLLEHLHQSFFFYLLLQSKRFVSIGTYLPSAMLIAVNFSITALALWVKSGKPAEGEEKIASTNPEPSKPATDDKSNSTSPATDTKSPPATEIVKLGDAVTIVPQSSTTTLERPLLLPALLVLTSHAIGLVPLYYFNTHPSTHLRALHLTAANASSILPFVFAWTGYYAPDTPIPTQTFTLIQCFSLLGLGLGLAALATLNFSLSIIIGVLSAPLSFVRRTESNALNILQLGLLAVLNPVMVAQWSSHYLGADLAEVLRLAAVGWRVWGLWTQVVVWVVWFPAWVVGGTIVAGGMF